MVKLVTQPKNITTIVRKEVIDVIREVLSDPDIGLELTQGFIKRLKKSVKEKEVGKTTPLSEVFKRYGI
ncbi:MAG: hypothetical protein CO145_00545 [Candidatus Nealsonbacteria bacterium CG_4_9_14_3_um_filter_37_13]|uniref:Signal recognition particle SRP54 helical bundle domain-containing protein n=1 Tax=Candidatus Nealsonbacteria bacterium CG_4_9_14_3_um_filter_37_13 TaxID=1974695 RepID=A0A2M7Z5M7_9BACT|nr:MAG: hypothetical protein CO145_00545 [Candidatus Nealsonbacteria bacterium CG_4_9_14_3_um_filter_37_13]